MDPKHHGCKIILRVTYSKDTKGSTFFSGKFPNDCSVTRHLLTLNGNPPEAHSNGSRFESPNNVSRITRAFAEISCTADVRASWRVFSPSETTIFAS
jgi:hypothetical protein